MKKNQKAQGAMEYLMTYGWAIVVIVAIGAVLWYLGLFGGQEAGVVTVSGFSKIKPLESSVIMTSDCSFSGVFINGAGSSIKITDIEIYNIGDEWSCTNNISGEGEHKTGAEIMIRQSGCCYHTHAEGESYALRIKINYTKVVAGTPVESSETGNIYGHYTSQVQLFCEIDQGGVCCPGGKICSSGHIIPASDCDCCDDASNCITTTSTSTTSTSTTSTTSTSTSTSTTSTIPESISMVEICPGEFYLCSGTSDGICPENFCSGCECAPSDPDC